MHAPKSRGSAATRAQYQVPNRRLNLVVSLCATRAVKSKTSASQDATTGRISPKKYPGGQKARRVANAVRVARASSVKLGGRSVNVMRRPNRGLVAHVVGSPGE